MVSCFSTFSLESLFFPGKSFELLLPLLSFQFASDHQIKIKLFLGLDFTWLSAASLWTYCLVLILSHLVLQGLVQPLGVCVLPAALVPWLWGSFSAYLALVTYLLLKISTCEIAAVRLWRERLSMTLKYSWVGV